MLKCGCDGLGFIFQRFSVSAFQRLPRLFLLTPGSLLQDFAHAQLHLGLEIAAGVIGAGEAVGLAGSHRDFLSEGAVRIPATKHTLDFTLHNIRLRLFFAVLMPLGAVPVRDAGMEIPLDLLMSVGVPPRGKPLEEALSGSITSARTRCTLPA